MKGSVLVVGAGQAGMRATSELLEQGFKVYLVERRPTIGGKMAQIDKMFPSNECATCTILPHMLELTSNPNLTLLAYSELVGLEGEAGDFKANIVKKPRYVDPMKCTACTDCFPVCPVGGIPMEFNLGRGVSKAISFYSPFPPRKALIHAEVCDYINKGKCGDKEKPPCVEACEPGAIDFTQKPVEVEIDVGAVILATGLDEAVGKPLGEYGHGKSPNVLTALEYERLLSGLGPTGGVVKRDDGSVPASVAWLVLDEETPIGFMTSITQAMGSREKNSETSVTVLCDEIPLLTEPYEEFLGKAREQGIEPVKSSLVKVSEGEGGMLKVTFEREGAGEETIEPDMLVLVPPLVPSDGVGELAAKIGITVSEKGFLGMAGNGSHPLRTSKNGVFVCGGAQGVKGIGDSIIQACSAAAQAGALLAGSRGTELSPPPKKELLPVGADEEPSIAVVICRCGMNIAGLLEMDELVEYTKSLPHVAAVEVTPFGCDGIKLKELLKSGKYNRLVLGGCSPKTHENLFQLHTEMGGLNRFLLEIVNLRNHCTWVHSKDKKEATDKAKTLMRMGVTRAALLEPLEDIYVPITQSSLVIGGGPSGVACAATLGRMGFRVHLVESESELEKVEGNDNAIVRNYIKELRANDLVKIHTGVRLGAVEGFIGSYKAELVNADHTNAVDVGTIVVATADDMRGSAEEADYEKSLALVRDERNHFVPKLGIMNQMDFNTEGVFMAGPARTGADVLQSIVEGEAAASRVAGILTDEERVKTPSISFVVDENCDGCAYCVEPCPAEAITLIEYRHETEIKKTVQVNEAICRGCGICMATCPKKGIFVRHFKPEQFGEVVKSVRKAPQEEFEPKIVTFCCNWCSYAAADAAGTARLQYPSSIHIVRAMCTGMIHPNFVMEALTQGVADGVLVCGCHIGDCHYQEGNKKAQARAEAIELMLEDFGLEPERFKLEWVSAAEGPTFARIARDMTEAVKKVGPNPFRA